MKKKLFGFALIAVTLTFIGCGMTRGLTGNANVKQTSVELSQKNYTIVKTVEGSAEGTYVLFIGGLSKKYLAKTAEAEMLKDAKLTGSQAIINQTTTIQSVGFFPIYWKYKTISQGQVIEFTK